jgi:AcrR family transcriptional regulator
MSTSLDLLTHCVNSYDVAYCCVESYAGYLMSVLRDRKKAALRATIVRSAVDLFVERGYDAVGMEEIAYASMCSRSTLNRYFGTKEDVLFPAVPEVIAGLRGALDSAVSTDDRWSAARRVVTTQLQRFFDNFEPDMRVAIMRLWFNEPVPRRRYLEIAHEWEGILKEYFAAGLPDDPATRFYTQVHASAIVSALRAVLNAAIESGDDIGTLADEAFGMLEKGLPTVPKPKRRKPTAGGRRPRSAAG